MRIIILSLLSSLFFGGCSVFDQLYYKFKQGAPEGTIEQRDAWGQKHLGGTYRLAVGWVKQAKVVDEYLGNVSAVASIGESKRTSNFWGDLPKGSYTLEIVGDKAKGIFLVEQITTCTWEFACFEKGILKLEKCSIEVHQSGIAMDEFNKPTNKIAYITNQINWYNKHEDVAPEKSSYHAYKLWYKRAHIYAANKNLENAIFDMRIATILLHRREKEFGYSEPSNELLRYQHKLAKYYYCAGKIEKSAEITNSILKTPSLKEHEIEYYTDKFSCDRF